MVGYCHLATTDCAAKAIMRQWLCLYFPRPLHSPIIVAYQWRDVIQETWCWEKAQVELDSCLFHFGNSVDGVNHFIIISPGSARRVTWHVSYIYLGPKPESYSCIRWLRQVDLAESIPLRVKPKPMSSNWKAHLRHGHMVIDSFGGSGRETLRQRNLGTSHPAMPRHHLTS